MGRFLLGAAALFVLAVYVGFLVPSTIKGEATALQSSGSYTTYSYLSSTTVPLLSATNEVVVNTISPTLATSDDVDTRLVGMLLHLKWLIARNGGGGSVNKTLFDKQVQSLMDDTNDDIDDLRDEVLGEGDFDNSTLTNPVFSGPLGSNIPLGPRYVSGDGDDEGIAIDSDGNVHLTGALEDTSGDAGASGYVFISTGSGTNWVSTSSLGISNSLGNDDVTPDNLLSTSQTDEYCLTYESTGDTWEWETCGTGTGIGTTDIDTSAELSAILTDETGSGALVFAGSPTLTGTLNAASAYFSGNVGIGTTTPATALDVFGGLRSNTSTFGTGIVDSNWGLDNLALLTQGNGNTDWGLVVATYGANPSNTGISFIKSRSTNGDTYGLVQNNDYLGGLSFNADDGAALQWVGNINMEVDGVASAGDVPTRLTFTTTPDGTVSPTERMRIDNAGNVGIGSTSPSAKLTIQNTGSGNSFLVEDQAGDATPFVIDVDGDVGIGTNSAAFDYKLDVRRTSTITSGFGEVIGASIKANPASVSSANYYAGEFYASSQSGNTFGLGSLTGVLSGIDHVGTGAITNAYGTYSYVDNVSTGSVVNATTISANAYNSNVSGTITTLKYLDISNIYNAGTIGSTYGLYLGDLTSGTQTNQAYSVYASDANTRNYFAGNVGIATTSPWQELAINGDIALTGRIYDSLASAGTSGMVLQTTGTATRWVATSTLGLAAGSSLLTDGGANTYVTSTGDNFSIGGAGGSARLNVYGDIDVTSSSAGITFAGTRYIYASTTNDSIALGEFAGAAFTSGTSYNVALGHEAGRSMSSANADYMLMLGYQAGYSNTGDHTNIVGFGSGFSNSGDYTNILGQSAGLANSGDYSNLIGAFSGRNNTGGFNNFIGHSVGFSNTGNYNNFIGYYTGYNNTGHNNDFIGYQAGRYVLSSTSVAIGAEALYGSHATNYYASNNVALGYRAGYASDDGASNNILIGYQAADNLTTGNNNIIIGYNIDNVSATADNRLNIGNLIFGTGLDGTGTTLSSGNIGIGTTTPAQKLQVLGNIRVGTAGGNGCLEDFAGTLISGTCSSDENLKKDIEPIAKDGRSYLASLAALTPVTYTWNETAGDLYSKDVDFENLGLIAQDVEAQFPELVSLNDEGYRQVNFSAFPFYIIEALKEVWQKIQGQDGRLEQLEQENDYLKERIENIEDELNIDPAPQPIVEEPTSPEPETLPSGESVEPSFEVMVEPTPESEEPPTPPEEPTYVLVPAAVQ